MTSTHTFVDRVADLVNDPSTPAWVPPLLDQLVRRDPVDVVHTLQVVYELFEQHCREVFEANGVQLTPAGIVERVAQVFAENGPLPDRISQAAHTGLAHYLSTPGFRVVTLDMALGLFALGYDYHRTYGALPPRRP